MMVWWSTVKCADCGTPLDVDADVSVCPYCYSSSPRSELAQTDAVGDGWWAYPLAIAGLIAVATMLASDIWFGTSLLPTLLETVDAWVE